MSFTMPSQFTASRAANGQWPVANALPIANCQLPIAPERSL